MERPSSASSPRRSFLSLGIALTLLGSLIVAAAIAMPGWQILDLPELNAVHEHAIFYDCILSEITPLDALRRALRDVSRSVQPSRRCTYKFATSSPWETAFVRMAIEEGDFAAREHLNLHRFLPQHKAVIFFCVFTLVFGLFSAVVGACSSCFVPNAVLHVISLALAASCSLFADFLFFLASQRDGNRRIQGDAVNYQQHLSYAFFIHCLGSLTLVLALLASIVAAYLLLAKKCREWKHRKTQECLMEEANDANKHDRCLFLSDVLALRPRAGTGLSLEVPQLPPPPPTPQQCQQQHLRLTGRCKEKGLISRSDFNEANPCPSSMLLSPKSSAGSSYCYSAV